MSGDTDWEDAATMADGGSPAKAPETAAGVDMDDAATFVPESTETTSAGESPARRFEISGELGRGGMGVVYEARDRKLGRVVALKCVNPESTGDERTVQRFWREAKAIASLNHFNITQIYNVIEQGKELWIEMEYVPGGSVKDKVAKDGPLSAEEVAAIGRQIASALDHAHAKGIFHRDVKPGNILLTERGTPKLGDFGLAQDSESAGDMTVAGSMMGTMFYASPEQLASAGNVDARSDVYSLGATLYNLCTGESPRAVRLDRVPEAIRDVVAKCLEEHPDNRYQTAAELEMALADGATSPKARTAGDACPECGEVNPLDTRFCQKCGRSLDQLFRKCPKCGRENHNRIVFCGHCGENVPHALFALRARQAQANREWAKAARMWQKLLKANPEHEQAKRGMEAYRRVVAQIREYAAKARAAREINDREASCHWYRKILDVYPGHEEAKTQYEASRKWLVDEKLRRARTFMTTGKYERAHEVLESALEIDEINKAALDMLQEVSRHHRPAAKPRKKTAIGDMPMGMKLPGAGLDRRVVMAVALGFVVVLLVVLFSLSMKGSTEQANLQARKTLDQARTAAAAYLADNPGQPLTDGALAAAGFVPAKALDLTVLSRDDGAWSIAVSHKLGDTRYTVDNTGKYGEVPMETGG
ncbi:MAG: protein kinase domain-containing protein [Desulfatibacillaceae bacterium]